MVTGHISHDLLASLLALSSQAFVIGYPDGSLGLMNPADYGPLLGLSPDSSYTATKLRLYTGDIFTLTTDGVTEAHSTMSSNSKDKEYLNTFFGVEGVAKVIQAAHPILPESINELQQTIVSEAINWANGHQRDDICLLTVILT
jgi:serine phosphatase RsbU (regulator of sigma subunit)